MSLIPPNTLHIAGFFEGHSAVASHCLQSSLPHLLLSPSSLLYRLLSVPRSLLFIFCSSPPPHHYPLPVVLSLSLALHLLFSPCVLPVAHDPAVQPKADCGAHTAGEAALGGALAQRTGASSSSCSSLFSL